MGPEIFVFSREGSFEDGDEEGCGCAEGALVWGEGGEMSVIGGSCGHRWRRGRGGMENVMCDLVTCHL